MDKITRAVKPHTPTLHEPNVASSSAPRFIGSGPGNRQVAIELIYPIGWDGREYRVVELCRLKGRDFSRMRRLTAAGVGEDEAMLAIISGLPVEVIQELDGDDYLALLEAARDFIPARFREMAESGPNSESGQDTQGS